MKNVTLDEAKKLIEDYAHLMNVSIEKIDKYGLLKTQTIMNDLNNWSFYGKQIGFIDNNFAAETAINTILKFADGKFQAYSNAFNFSDTYQIIDEQ
ncbi:MAG: hypothetical protein ACJARG_000040 [Arcticibacterium sp.]|jgi:hypothetical protein